MQLGRHYSRQWKIEQYFFWFPRSLKHIIYKKRVDSIKWIACALFNYFITHFPFLFAIIHSGIMYYICIFLDYSYNAQVSFFVFFLLRYCIENQFNYPFRLVLSNWIILEMKFNQRKLCLAMYWVWFKYWNWILYTQLKILE